MSYDTVTHDSDRAFTICGVPGRLTHRTRKPGLAPQLWTNQKWISERRAVRGWGKGAEIRAEIRFDDDCGNGHNSFAIVGDISIPGRLDCETCGCIHDEIRKYFPELAHLIRWHLHSTESPMHYIANTVYHAGDRDHNGKRAGEAYAWDEKVQFGDVPVLHKASKCMRAFMAQIADYDRERKEFHLIPVAVAHKDQPGGSYKFAPKFQFCGQDPLAWHECEFDTEDAAQRWAAAILDHSPRVVRIPTLFSEGKARDFDAARSCGVWPDATDAELSADPADLKAALAARLPGLIAAMRADIEAIGFYWSAEDYRHTVDA